MARNKDYFLIKKENFRETKSQKRVLVKKETSQRKNSDLQKGIVVVAIGKIFLVENNETKEIFECQIGGTINTPHKDSTLVAVGDEVEFYEKNIQHESEFKIGVIQEVQARKSKLSRRKAGKHEVEQVLASNIDTVIIFCAAIDPSYNRRLIDRYLIIAEQNDLEPVIVINKTDLIELDSIIADFDIYRELNIPVFFISVFENQGLEELNEYIREKVVLVTGPSGVGKSSYINMLIGDEQQVVSQVSDKTSKGQHTTSFVKMFYNNLGGRIIDSPGLRELAIWEIDKTELSLYFHDFDEIRYECKYTTCTHTHEPECRIIHAYEEGEIDPQRYESYLSLYSSIGEE